ncbi:MAG: hypothetical protein IPH07_30215 [Deltaproteobacteria bacterium]|nr:hypothetical protein [Deltaproteobacteria bacterium]MBK8715190.1 hypothetical protein [Deltaproteobacteria bacterium]MBP7285104.1 hypothetical protein [Nannocystaceae bacterium]
MRSIRRTFLSLVLPAIGLGACEVTESNPYLQNGDDETGAAADSAGESGSGTTGDPTTGDAPTTGTDPTDADPTTGDDGPCSGACIPEPAAPDGWQGPVRLATGEGDEAPTCSGAWRDVQALAYDGIEGAPAECSCSCDASAVQCPTELTLEQRADTPGDCHDSTLIHTVTVEPGCNLISRYESTVWLLRTPEPEGGCVPVEGSAVPEPEFGRSHALCGPSEGATGSCDEGTTCHAAPPEDDAPICIWQAGDLTCPPGGYSARHRFDTTYSDGRGCTECTCGPLAASCEVGSLVGYPYSTACGSSVVQLDLNEEGCVPAPGGIGSVDYPVGSIPNLVGGSCDPTASVPTGELEVTGHITVCCLE